MDDEREFIRNSSAWSYIDQSRAFMDVSLFVTNAEVGAKGTNQHSLLHVAIVDALFALELAVKALILIRGEDPPRTHQVSELKETSMSDVDKREIKTRSIAAGASGDDIEYIFSFTNEYTIQRYNEGCIGDHLLPVLRLVTEVVIDICEESETYRTYANSFEEQL